MLKNPKHYLFDTKYLVGETAPAWEEDTGFLDIYNDIRQYTLVSPARLHTLFQFARQANNLPGDFAQVGVVASLNLRNSANASGSAGYMYCCDGKASS